MNAPVLPQSLKTNPTLDRWVRFNPDRSVTVYSGKVELGQGIVTAIAQVAAEELDVAPAQLHIVPGDTRVSPDEWYTAGSQSIEVGALAMRLACAEVRSLFVDAAASRFGVASSAVAATAGEFSSGAQRASYWDLCASVDLARPATGSVKAKAPAMHTVVGASLPRRDIVAKVTGAAYVQDMELPGMVFGRVLMPPAQGARLKSLDAASIRALPGVVHVFVSGSFVAIAAEREEQVVKALEAARKIAVWSAGLPMPVPGETADVMQRLPSTRAVTSSKGADTAPAVAQRFEAAYSRPYLAHASIGTCCALAQIADGKLTIWSHTQGPHFLRGQIALVMGMPAADVEVVHRDGAGCYGHNGADDVALDAALLARACGRPVLLTWTREDELVAAPCGSAMLVKMRASLDADQQIVEWSHELWSHTHIKRPGWAEGVNLLAAWHMDPPHPVPPAKDMPLPAGGGDRNAVPLYDFPQHEVAYNFIAEMPIRVSALRTLGAHANVFAIESFLDEMAADVGIDPVEFRLRHMKDPRARAVIEAAAKAAGWKPGQLGDDARGMGIGFARYKNLSAYCAVVVEIEVAEAIRVVRAVAAVDAGQIVNPDGLKNQVEGGIVQAISWTLKEAMHWDRERITSRSWEDYPILKFDEVPQIEVVLINRPDQPGLGSGECAAGPTSAAIGNALWQAMGLRMRDLPLTPESIARALV
jgi:CO/xanthine dehydrogenase Mo-binding subunit